ncbi:translation factor SUA5 [Anaerobacterium chartisolvens]|uniref:Threonylcarbamoyl-AMP synthase n=1 Tax=Anaerobacterium chartisolvens TaxID=1297424 RepID=A0A369AYU8_9FIRM|nr:L-threonylcarbamoyladenylate synthase [Anaerobacterium chartisolvens]RCX14333.1 translation factor SUA5 [Anaerobacterium chartisolvens]
MKTEIIALDVNSIDMGKLGYCAEVIKSGGLVAFPTETVYGLGANALDGNAVSGIFEAKGRPGDNPLIVHVACKDSVNSLVAGIPYKASLMMDKLWPGPLTIIMEKSGIVPDAVTAGLNTVGVRMPAHPVALALIREAGVPVAAPSANTSGLPSPTIARHVIEDLQGKVHVIIDAGSAQVGLESTVVDMTSVPPAVLRPGGITLLQLEGLVGPVSIEPSDADGAKKDSVPKAPGMKYTHYSPRAKVIVVEGEVKHVAFKIKELAGEYKGRGIKAGILATRQTIDMYPFENVISMGDRDNPETIAARLFKVLREMDSMGVQVIISEAIDSAGIGLAVMNRMNKAAGYNIIRV